MRSVPRRINDFLQLVIWPLLDSHGFRAQVSRILIFTILFELIAPATVLALPGRPSQDDSRVPATRHRRVRQPRLSADPQVEKALNRVRAPLQSAMSAPADSDLLPQLLDPNTDQFIAADHPQRDERGRQTNERDRDKERDDCQDPSDGDTPTPTETPQPDDQEPTPTPTPSACPTPRCYPVPNWTPPPSGWDSYNPSPSPSPCNTNRHDDRGDRDHDRDDRDDRDHHDRDKDDHDNDRDDCDNDSNSGGHHNGHDDECDDIDNGDDRGDDCHRRKVKPQLAKIVLPTDVGSPIHAWTRHGFQWAFVRGGRRRQPLCVFTGLCIGA